MGRQALSDLRALGQSVWLDQLGRDLIHSGTLERLIAEDGVSGVTSNPSIFEAAIAGSSSYDAQIARDSSLGSAEIYHRLVERDVAAAADLLQRLHARTHGADGYVSLEVPPRLAHDIEGTIAAAARAWRAIGRAELLIKVPATRPGIAAIRQLVADGINVNATLLFSVERYAEVLDAYIDALEKRLESGLPVSGILSVASFFVSRIDSEVDSRLDAIIAHAGARAGQAASLRGRSAIACARLAYAHFARVVAGKRFGALAARGARAQKLLWASTSTKNPAYPDLKYVEALIGADTIDTMPLATLLAYLDHGRPAARLATGLDEARATVTTLASLGIPIESVAAQLEDEGVRKFVASHDATLAAIEAKRRTMVAPT